MKILITGSAGFIAGYLAPELLGAGHTIVGIDNFSKYGRIAKSYDGHERFSFTEGDASDSQLVRDLAEGCDMIVASAARIGGISYFHEFAYDLLADNERIIAATFDAALHHHRKGTLKRIVVLSSSMVFENATIFPSPEGHERECPPPSSTYGFQKLACEYFVQGAWEQYQLPYTILRPFNCVGIGEQRALTDVDVPSGNIKLAMSHVVPDLCQKVFKGQDPLRILGSGDQVRHYTYGGDLAHGIRMAIESESAVNQDFNLSTAVSTTVKELAEVIWRKIRGSNTPLKLVHDEPFPYDVQRRVPETAKAREILGFEATTGLDEMLDEVIPWIENAIAQNQI
jgi:nucleoside-diphosphate-sugar epimerase